MSFRVLCLYTNTLDNQRSNVRTALNREEFSLHFYALYMRVGARYVTLPISM